MASVNLLRFFFSPEDPQHEAVVPPGEQERFSRAGSGAVLRGPALGKRSLSWALCASLAAEDGRCIFVSSKKRTENKGAPLMTPGSRQAEELWRRLLMRYVETPDEALLVLLSVHQLPDVPRAIVLEHPLMWFGAGKDMADKASVRMFGALLAALEDAAAYCRQKSGKSCITLVTAGPNIAPVAEHMLKRWIPLTLELSRMQAHVLLTVVSEEHEDDDNPPPKIKFTVNAGREFSLSSYA